MLLLLCLMFPTRCQHAQQQKWPCSRIRRCSPGRHVPLLLCLVLRDTTTVPCSPCSCQPVAMLLCLVLIPSLILPCSMMTLLEGLPMEPTQTQLEQLELLVGQAAPDESKILTQSRQRVLSQQQHNVHWQQENTAAVCAWLLQHLEQSLP